MFYSSYNLQTRSNNSNDHYRTSLLDKQNIFRFYTRICVLRRLEYYNWKFIRVASIWRRIISHLQHVCSFPSIPICTGPLWYLYNLGRRHGSTHFPIEYNNLDRNSNCQFFIMTPCIICTSTENSTIQIKFEARRL